MAWKQLGVAAVQDAGEREFAFESSEELAAAGNTPDLLIPDDVQTISVTVQASGGATANVYTTTDPISIVKAAATVTWVAWSAGAVTTATAGVFYPVTAIRMTQTGAGASKMTLRVQ